MAEHMGELDKDRPGTAADETIRRFLLGSLSGAEQVRLEESLFSDKDVEERMRAVECELADDYAGQRLSAAEREQFEKRFLVTSDRRRKLAVSVALRDHLATHADAKRPTELSRPAPDMSPSEKSSGWLSFNRPAFGFAIAFVLLILFAGIVWLAVKSRRPQQHIVRQHPIVGAAPERPPELSHPDGKSPTPNSTVSPVPTPNSTTPPTEPQSLGLIATFELLPEAGGGGGQTTRVTIPQASPDEHAIVRLQLVLEKDEPGTHSAELLTAEGVSAYTGQQLRTSNADSTTLVVFDVPARLLKSGDYQVKLNWIAGGSVTSSRRYSFRVT